MSKPVSLLRKAVGTAAVCTSFALAAVIPASAAASEWVQGEDPGIKLTAPSLTLSMGSESRQCSWKDGSTAGDTGENYGAEASFKVRNTMADKNELRCLQPKDTVTLPFELSKSFHVEEEEPGEFVVQMWGNEPPFLYTPWQYYNQLGAYDTATWVNGSEGNPSTIVFDDAIVGQGSLSKVPVRISGTVEVTTPSGGLLTVQ